MRPRALSFLEHPASLILAATTASSDEQRRELLDAAADQLVGLAEWIAEVRSESERGIKPAPKA